MVRPVDLRRCLRARTSAGDQPLSHHRRGLRNCPTRLLAAENVGTARQQLGSFSGSRHLSRDRGLVFHLPSLADGARRPRCRLRGACRDPRRPPWRLRLKRKGFTFIPSPGAAAALTRAIWSASYARCATLYRTIKPALAHHVALPATVVGSLAATGLPIVCLNAMTGLGTTFTSDAVKVRLVRAALTLALRRLLNRDRSAILVQNLDDRAVIERLGVNGARIALIPGSGVDIETMTPKPEPPGRSSSHSSAVWWNRRACARCWRRTNASASAGARSSCFSPGPPDPANPMSIPAQDIEAWSKRPNVTHLGFVEDIGALWASAHIAVLPSHREGMPLSLLEAAACGRPLVATDVPGCRDIARPGVNAFLVPLDDAEALADAIDRLAGDPELAAEVWTRQPTSGRAELLEQPYRG